MTETTHAPQQTVPTQEPVVPRSDAWPVNSPYQNPYQTNVPQWPPTQPPEPPADQPPADGGATPHRGRRRTVVAAVVAAMVLAGGAAGGVIGAQLDHGTAATASTATTATGTTATTASSSQLADMVARVSPSIVTVTVNTGQGTAEGSGIVLTADGRIVTNNHVVDGAAGSGAIKVTLADGRTVAATLVGTDPTADIAVLQAENVSGLTAATLGDSSNLQVGDTVLAFGSPLGLEGTVTSGIISAQNRTLSTSAAQGESGESLSGLLQTDAAINPGNSGGALVDTAGRVVGINVAIATTGQDSGNIGVGFAIPINTAKTVINQIVSSA